jgi:hypothetical protein
MLRHSPVAFQRDPTSKLHTRKSDWTVSCRSSVACQHTRRSVLTISCRNSVAGCKIKKYYPTVQWHASMIQPANCIQQSQIAQCLATSQWRVSTQGGQSRQYLAIDQRWVAGSSKKSNQSEFQKASRPVSQQDAGIPIGAHQHHQEN